MMNKEKAEKILALVQAFVDGKQLQMLNGNKDSQWWSDDNDPNFNLPDLLRVKPEPRQIKIYEGDQIQIHMLSNPGYELKYIEGPAKFIEVLDD